MSSPNEDWPDEPEERSAGRTYLAPFTESPFQQYTGTRTPQMRQLQPLFPYPESTFQSQILIQSHQSLRTINENLQQVRQLFTQELNTAADTLNNLLNSEYMGEDERYWLDDVVKALNKEKQTLRTMTARLGNALKDGTQTERTLADIVPQAEGLERQTRRLYAIYLVLGQSFRATELYYAMQQWLMVEPHMYRFNDRPPFVSTDTITTPAPMRVFQISPLNASPGESQWKKVLKELRWDFRQFHQFYGDLCENVMNGDFNDLYQTLDFCPRFGSSAEMLAELANTHQTLVNQLPNTDAYLHSLALTYNLPDTYESYLKLMEELRRFLATIVRLMTFRNRIFEINNIRKSHYIVEVRGYVPRSEYPPGDTREIEEVRLGDVSEHYFEYRDNYDFLDAWRLVDQNGELIPGMVQTFQRQRAMRDELRDRFQ